jgi:putative transposase
LCDDETGETIGHHSVVRDRERIGRGASPTAGVIDSRSVETTASGGVRGYDAGRQIRGRERHATVGTGGRGGLPIPRDR